MLHIDDDPDMLRLVAAALQEPALTVLQATSGEAGLETALRERPDVVICDVQMPGMDGFSLCRAVKSDSRLSKARVLMVTGMGQNRDIEKALAEGADGYIVKPFDVLRLQDKVRAMLAAPAAE